MNRWIGGIGVVVAALTIGAFAAGCGDGGDSTASASVTKAQFVKKATAICADRKKRWEAKVASAKKEFEAEDASLDEEGAEELVSSSLLPLMKEELEELEDLGAPAGDEEKVSKILEARSEAIAKIEQSGVAAVYKPTTLGPFDEQAGKYGLKCPL